MVIAAIVCRCDAREFLRRGSTEATVVRGEERFLCYYDRFRGLLDGSLFGHG